MLFGYPNSRKYVPIVYSGLTRVLLRNHELRAKFESGHRKYTLNTVCQEAVRRIQSNLKITLSLAIRWGWTPYA